MIRFLGMFYFGGKNAAGCFLFVRRDAFETIGGFDEAYFAAEEVVLSRKLKKLGSTGIARHPVITSGRKVRLLKPHELLLPLLRILVMWPRALKRREGLEVWYDGRRESPVS